MYSRKTNVLIQRKCRCLKWLHVHFSNGNVLVVESSDGYCGSIGCADCQKGRCKMLSFIVKSQRTNETTASSSETISAIEADRSSNVIATNQLENLRCETCADESSDDDTDDPFRTIGARGIFDYMFHSDQLEQLSQEQRWQVKYASYHKHGLGLLGGGYEDTMDQESAIRLEEEINLEREIGEAMTRSTQEYLRGSSSSTLLPMGQVRLIATEFTAETMQPRVDAEILPPAVVEEEVEAAIDESQMDCEDDFGFQPLHAVSDELKRHD